MDLEDLTLEQIAATYGLECKLHPNGVGFIDRNRGTEEVAFIRHSKLSLWSNREVCAELEHQGATKKAA